MVWAAEIIFVICISPDIFPHSHIPCIDILPALKDGDSYRSSGSVTFAV